MKLFAIWAKYTRKKKDYRLAGFNYFAAAMGGSQKCEVHFLKLSYPDEKETYKFLIKIAVEKKYPSAYFMVGKRLIERQGVYKDAKTGITYLEKAAVQNHWGAKIYLAGIYIKGELLPQNIDKANELMGVENKTGGKKNNRDHD